ncbi:MAG: DUF4433 domain-containing protein [Gammaproteobacteria bacterium]|nr:DUF4433 domain-containing protein [Gammaproteobacteria bacterium]MCY4283395.1 DUF4433 domain-containing protein [Gammaproteobacteria bacterium]
MSVPVGPKIYHIVHIDRLASIINDGFLWCDSEAEKRESPGTTIGMSGIKQRRLTLPLNSHANLHVGDCVPFYFCPRSVMLYLIYQANHPELSYRGGQIPIIHLEADLQQTVNWADHNNLRWAFTLSNAGASYFEDRCDLEKLNEVNWEAVQALNWQGCKEGKQAEFLIEKQFPWRLVSRIGLHTQTVKEQANDILKDALHKPQVEIITQWYY